MARRRAFDWQVARGLRREGQTLRSIARLLGVSHVSIWHAVRGIPLPARRKHAQ